MKTSKINSLGLLSFIMTIALIASLFITQKAYSFTDEKVTNNCTELNNKRNELEKWSSSALKSNSSIGCPSVTNDSPIIILEKISQQQNKCAKEATGLLLAFYSIFSNHPNYKMCGLVEREELFLSRSAEDGKICHNQSSDKIRSCFSKIDIVISKLKMRGEAKAAFELAKKTANSDDVTGLSQMILAFLYQYGNGTDKDLAMTIKWQKEALQRLDARDQRIDSMISLSSAYEDLNDYQNAKIYLRQCASMGDLDCKKGLTRLTQSNK
ncbi:TPA: sel1 repeat family protein [Legionella pneumophila]|nr:sel1 repeat family protein [Legionella pneumophila]HBD9376075.1 sel1 repeat family protein [Legionella pneumophila]